MNINKHVHDLGKHDLLLHKPDFPRWCHRCGEDCDPKYWLLLWN